MQDERLRSTIDDPLFHFVPMGSDLVCDDSSISVVRQGLAKHSVATTVITIRVSRIEKVHSMIEGSPNGRNGQFVGHPQ